MEITPDPPKTWHNAKYLRKRTKFLLENIDIIPADITFRVGPEGHSEDFKGHKLILALGSPVFHSMFYGDMLEKNDVISVPDVEPDAFRILLKYLYCEDFLGLEMDNVMETLYCAKKYTVLRLLKHCRGFVQDNLTPEFACLINAKALNWDENNLRELALRVISSQTEKVLASPMFLDLPEKMLVAFLDCNDLSVDENSLYQAVRKWVVHNTENLPAYGTAFKETFQRLIYHIRVPVMSPSQIANGPGEDAVLTLTELMQVYTFKFAENKPAIPFSNEERTPRPDPTYVRLELIAHFGEEDAEDGEEEEHVIGRIRLEIRSDVAPLTSKAFLFLCNEDYKFAINYGDVELVRRHGEEDAMKGDDKTIPIENRLLANLPGMLSFIVKPGEFAPCLTELQICHADKKANKAADGVVFGRVLEGMEVLKHLDSFRDGLWDPKKGHPLTAAMPAVYFYFSNVVVETDLGPVVKAEDEDDDSGEEL